MRKDVKFGLTIGAILVVTLVIYVIVLSRGPSTAQKIGIAAPSQSDQANSSTDVDSSDPADSSVATHSDDAKSDGQSDQNANSPVNNTNAQSPAENSAPATQPTAAAPTGNDWDSALNHGLPMSLSAPEHTETPTIDPSSSSNLSHGDISRSPTTPMIDPLPSTQPSRPLLADVPTLDAPAAVTPPPAAAAPAPSSISTYASTASVPSNTPRTHRVESGESPYSISETVYGNGKYYKRILAANPGIDPKHLKIGQILVIPELTDTDKPASAAAANSAAQESIDTNSAYKVISGDTLESISRKLYGTPKMMEKLYEANKTLIGTDENVLKIGWTLKLPSAPVSASAQR